MATVFSNEVKIGDSVLDGDVVMLDVARYAVHGATERKPYIKLDINAVLPTNGMVDDPGMGLGPWNQLENMEFYVIAVLPKGTYDLDALKNKE